MKTETLSALEQQRIEDFYKVLTFYIVDKINYYFKGDVEKFSKISSLYNAFVACRNKKYKYSKELIHKIYDGIIKFNQCGMTSQMTMHILGKYESGKYLRRTLIELDSRVLKINNGSICMMQNIKNNTNDTIGKEKRRFHYTNKYLIKDIDFLRKVFADKELLEKIRDAGSDYYTDRQRRLIFTQILKQRRYHYKSSLELGKEKEEPTEEELLKRIEEIEL